MKKLLFQLFHTIIFLIPLFSISSVKAQEKQQIISFETALNIGDSVILRTISSTGAPIQVTGVDAQFINTEWKKYRLVDKKVTIKGPAKMIALFGNKITSLTFENAIYLDRIDCEENLLTSLDVSNVPNLVYLYAHRNEMTSINLSNCYRLKWLNCYNNNLREIDLRQLDKLETLLASDNPFDQLDLSGNTSLKRLECEGCNISDLDLTNCLKLTSLSCGYNKISDLNITSCVALQALSCNANRLTEINLSPFLDLNLLNCSRNQIEKIDFTGLKSLRNIYIECNKMSEQAMTESINTLPTIVSGNSGENPATIAVIDLSRNEEENICTKEAVAIAKEKGWTPLAFESRRYREYEGSNTKVEKQSIAFTTSAKKVTIKVGFTDDIVLKGATGNLLNAKDCELLITGDTVVIEGNIHSFEAFAQQLMSIDLSKARSIAVLKLAINNLQEIDLSQLSSLSVLDVTYNRLRILDLSKNPKLTRLFCYANLLEHLDLSQQKDLYILSCFSNQLTSLDLSPCPHLGKMTCDGNPLKSIDLTHNPELTSIWISSIGVSSVDLSKNTKLKQLICNNNVLHEIDLSNNPDLDLLYCGINNLTALDLSNKEKLQDLWIFNNKINKDEMQHIVEALPKHLHENQATFLVINTKSKLEQNICTASQVTLAKNKNWKVMDLNSENFQTDAVVEYSGESSNGNIIDPRISIIQEKNTINLKGAQPGDDIRLITMEGISLFHTIADSDGNAILKTDILDSGVYLLCVNSVLIQKLIVQ